MGFLQDWWKTVTFQESIAKGLNDMGYDLQSPDKHQADRVNANDPAKNPSFQLPPNPTCDQMDAVLNALQNEMVVSDQLRSKGAKTSDAVNAYHGKLQNQISSIQSLQTINQCARKKAESLAASQTAQQLQAAQKAQQLANQNPAALTQGSPMTIGLIAVGSAFLIISAVIIIKMNKSKPMVAAISTPSLA